jgi:hypothetical protein
MVSNVSSIERTLLIGSRLSAVMHATTFDLPPPSGIQASSKLTQLHYDILYARKLWIPVRSAEDRGKGKVAPFANLQHLFMYESQP